MPSLSSVLLYVAVLALLVALPLFVGGGTIGALINVLIAALFALAYNLLIGQGGMMSFGHSAYFAFGTFATLHVMKMSEAGILYIPTPLLPVAGGVAGLVVGLIAGYFATLRSGVYFAMVTLAVAELFHLLAPNLAGIFGGEAGISTFRAPFGPFSFSTDRQVYYLLLCWVLACAALLYLFTLTPFGRLTLALRDNEERVAFMGYNLHRSKTLVFAISAMFAGIAGGLFAVANESGNYVLFGMEYSTNVVLHTVIGGSGVFLGPALGAALLSLAGFYASDATKIWFLYQGIIFILVVMYLPQGLGGLIADLADAARRGDIVRVLWRGLAMCVPVLLMVAGAAFLLEGLAHIFSREYVGLRTVARGGWPAFNMFGKVWDPTSLSTWVPALTCFILGSICLSWLLRRHREAASE